MLFFSLNLFVYFVISVFLLVLLLKSLNKNWRRKNRLPAGYLTPVILTIAFTWFSVTQTIPRLIDLPLIISGRTISEEMVFSEDDIGWMSIENNEQRFIYYRWQFSPQADITYRVRYTPYSLSIIGMQEISETIPTALQED